MTEQEFLTHQWYRVSDKNEAILNMFEGADSKEDAIEWAKSTPEARTVDEFIGYDYKNTIYNK